ncbi:mitochondrial ribosomal protein L9 [Megalopta genalis]|uniref:mitochondrial ribosomal protein L9 n=1 Tax=Megalopta genalis TaxID=115081 RepID=UPI003FCF8CD2
MFLYTKMCINHIKTKSMMLLPNQLNLSAQQSRNTYILKRRYPVPLHKKNQKPHPLKSKHYIYDLIENTNSRKQQKIDLILLDTIEGLGLKGQKISVASQKAYNNLLLPKLAVYATPENIEKYLINASNIKDTDIRSSEFVTRAINSLSHLYLPMHMSMHVPWTIEKWHVKVSFRKAGVIVPEDAITMPEKKICGPDLSIESKEFYVIVKINNQEEVKVRCKVLHWTNDTENILNDIEIYNLPNEAIFPEDQPVLDSLPKHRLYKNQSDDKQ